MNVAGEERMIHIAAVCDANYAMPLAVMLASLAATLGPERVATVYILESGLDAATRKRVEQSVRGTRIALRWVTLVRDRLAALRPTLRKFDYASLASYYRLLLPEAVPGDVDKLIYLDCDLVIRRDIGALWDIDIGDAPLLAVPELSEAARLVSSREGIRRHRDVGLADDQLEFNAGVMLINLRVWREEHVALRAFAYLRAAGHGVRWQDQDALNVVTAPRWRPLDSRWNVTMHAFRGAADAEEAKRLLAGPFIVHYNTAQKPWHVDFPYGFRELFEHYLDATAWAGWRPPHASQLQKWRGRLVRALLKRREGAARVLRSLRGRGRVRIAVPLVRLDGEPPSGAGEIRLFVAGAIGPETADRIARELSTSADRAIILCTAAEACVVAPASCVHRFVMRTSDRKTPHERLAHLLMRYGPGHWCVILAGDEVMTGTGEERRSLRDLRDALEREGADALLCRVGEASGVVRVSAFAADPLTGRVMIAPAVVEASDGRTDHFEWRSRIAMLKFRPGMEIAEGLRAVRGAKLATIEGVLRR